MIILVDADGVLEDLTEKWVLYLNELYGTNVKYEDIKEWDMTKDFPMLTREQIYETEIEERLYERLEPLPGARECLEKLIDRGHRIFVVTSTPFQVIKVKFERAIFRFYPFLTWKDVIIASDKKMIKGDVLIDDGVHNLEGGEYRKILMDAPYNESYDAEGNGMVRVKNWEEIYAAVLKFEEAQSEK